jgi:hypothetical protein
MVIAGVSICTGIECDTRAPSGVATKADALPTSARKRVDDIIVEKLRVERRRSRVLKKNHRRRGW